MTYVTQIISFSFISVMGLILFLKSLPNWFRKAPPPGNKTQTWLFTGPFATAFAVGLIPCPGVVMVMLFALSLNLNGLGILLGSCITAGMASTITLVIIAGMSGKSVILKLSGRQEKLRYIVKNWIETIAGLLVGTLGLIMLLANV